MNRLERIIDWGYDNHPMWNIPALCIRLVTGIWCCMNDFARQQKVKERI